MKVFADNRLVWEGSLAAQASLDGPVGIRSDNAGLQIQLRVGCGSETRAVARMQVRPRRIGKGERS